MKKNAFKIVSVLVGVAGVYLIYKYIKGRKDTGKVAPLPVVPPPVVKPPVTPKNTSLNAFPLAKGSRGSNVILLQMALKNVDADSIFGNLTEASLLQQTGKKSVASFNEIKAIGKKNGLGFIMTPNGVGKFVPETEVPIIQQSPDYRPEIFR
jgi:hypothetical protein